MKKNTSLGGCQGVKRNDLASVHCRRPEEKAHTETMVVIQMRAPCHYRSVTLEERKSRIYVCIRNTIPVWAWLCPECSAWFPWFREGKLCSVSLCSACPDWTHSIGWALADSGPIRFRKLGGHFLCTETKLYYTYNYMYIIFVAMASHFKLVKGPEMCDWHLVFNGQL